MTFNRHGLWLTRTWAYHSFKRHHTELNRLYWSYVPARIEAKKKGAAIVSSTRTDALFNLRGEVASRVSAEAANWQIDFAEFDNWIRLSSLTSLLSYFEIYTRSVCSMALESDPSALLGLRGEIDGTKILKHVTKYNRYDETKQFVDGDWSKRIGNYRKVFGSAPSRLEDFQGELQKMSNLRNSFAHKFGRSDSFSDTMEHLSQDRLQKYWGIVDEAALSIDEHLGRAYIGEYETIRFYHIWANDSRAAKTEYHITPPRRNTDRARNLAEALGNLFGRHPGVLFCAQLVDYYNSL